MSRRTHNFRRFVVIVYWAVLPICLLALVGAFVTIAPDGRYQPEWRLAVGAVALAALVGWRLRLNSRALGNTSKLPATGRLFRAFLPLGVLAALGSALILLGLMWTGFGIWILLNGDQAASLLVAGHDTYSAHATGILLVPLGLVVMAMGSVPNWFFWRLFRRQEPESTFPDAATDLEVPHD